MLLETFKQLERALETTSADLARDIRELAELQLEDRRMRKAALRTIERSRQKRDVAARALRLARLTHLHGHPQAGGGAT